MAGFRWKQLEYQIQDGQCIVDRNSPPFDGEPVLLCIPDGRIVQCRWFPSTWEGLGDRKPMVWKSIDDHEYLLGHYFWRPVIDFRRGAEMIYDCQVAQEKSLSGKSDRIVLVYVETGGWLSAYYEAGHGKWVSPSSLPGIPDLDISPEFVRMGCDLPEPPETGRITGALDPVWG